MTRVLSFVLALALGFAAPVAAHDGHDTAPVAGGLVAQAPDAGLFRAAAGDGPAAKVMTRASDELPPEVARRRVVQTDHTYLQARVMPQVSAPDAAGGQKRVAAGAGVVRLNLFADAVVDAVLEKVQHTQSGDLVWQGRPTAGPEGSVHLVISKGRVTGSVTAGGASYTIFPDRQGNTVIDQIDPAGFPKAGPHLVPDRPRTDKPILVPFWQAPADGPSIVGDPASMTIVTLVVAYTEAAASQSADIQSEINLAVAMANTAYTNSGVNIALQLVGTVAATYSESGKSAVTVVTEARAGMNGTGTLSELHAARRAYGADLVALIVQNYTAFQACGIAYMLLNPTVADGSYAVSASMRGSCITSNQTLAHEIGHNLGLAHDRYAVRKYNESPWNGTLPQDYDYFGYVDAAARELTVMSYSDACNDANVSCSRATRFSSPLRSFTNGAPSGVALGQTNPADNSRVLNVNKDVAARWRPTDASTSPVLTVVKGGTGGGTVSSSPSGISCGGTCFASFAVGQAVTLTASAAAGSVFSGWSNACSGSSATAVVTMAASASCGATFTASSSVTRPANDAFADGSVISGAAGSTTGSNVNGTKQTGEGNHAGNAGGKSVWWTWTPTGAGSVTITTAGSSFDTLLAVYTGSSVTALTAVASNDDTAASLQSSVTFSATAGQPYRIAVDGFGGASGSIVLTWAQTVDSAGPANNAFASAIALTAASGSTSGSNRSATKEAGEPRHAGNAGGASVWWKITPASAGTIRINTAGSSFDTLLAVYTGSAVGSLTEVASNDDTGSTLQSAVSFAATAGTTYHIAVDGYAGATGSIVLAYSGSSTSFTAQSGWWWAPSAPGSGFGIEQSGASMFVGAYLYDADGSAVWYAAMGTVSGSTFTGSLVEYTGGQTLTGAFQAPSVRQVVGTLTIAFGSATTATLTWPGGTLAIERFDIIPGGVAAGSATGDPETGWWWSEAEAGRGYFIEAQGSGHTMYMASYMYDADASAVWYVGSGVMTTGAFGSGMTFAGTLGEYADGQVLGGTWRSPSLTATRGAIILQFAGSRQATLTLPDGRQVTLTRFSF